MLLNADYVEPAELTGYGRAALADIAANQFSLARFLPNRDIDDLDYRFTRGGEGLTEAATFRSFDTEASISKRPGVTRVTGSLPPISRKIRLGEYDRLRKRKLDEAIGDAILKDGVRMVREIAARFELARGDALVNGSVTINEDGLEGLQADFGRSTDVEKTASTLWSTIATATPLTDLIAWVEAYKTANQGQAPGAFVTSTQVRTYLMRSAEIRQHVGGGSAPSIVSIDALNAVLAAFGIPPITTYDAQVALDGVATRVIPADKVLLLPAPVDADDDDGTDLGATLWGSTAEADEPEYGLEGDEPGIVVGAYKDNDPVAIWTKAAAIGLPVLANPNLAFVADVA